MADDKEAEERAAFIKSQGLKILDLLVKIAPISNGLKETWKVSRETEKALTIKDRTSHLGTLSASEGNLNRLREIANKIASDLSSLNRMDENWWIETSGANLFSVGESTKALSVLQQQVKYLRDLRAACEGLKDLARLIFASSVSDVKGLAKLYMPSIPTIDAIVMKEITGQFDVCIKLLDSIIKKAELAARTVADMNKAVDRFLILVNSQDPRGAVQAIGSGKPALAPSP
jgi:hypothetical protein